MTTETNKLYKEVAAIAALFLVVGVVIGMIVGTKINQREANKCDENLERAAHQIELCVDSYRDAVEFNHRLIDVITYRNCNNE